MVSPNSKLGTETDARLPTPLRVAVCGLVGSLSVTVSIPLRVPVWVGVNVTLTLHEAFAGRLAGQVLVWEKSPLAATLEIVSGFDPVFVTVTVLVKREPTTLPPKGTLAAERIGHRRCCKVKGGSGCWLKSKLSRVSFAALSRAVRGANLNRFSINFNTEANSYWVCEIKPFLA